MTMYCREPIAVAPRTYVSLALQTVRDPRWVEKQTGVALTTLRTHYKKWMPDPARDQFRRLERVFGSGGSAGNGPDLDLRIRAVDSRPEIPLRNPSRGGGLEPVSGHVASQEIAELAGTNGRLPA